MSSPELERRLAAVLKQHAEDTMKDTHTEEKLKIFLDHAEQDGRRRRRGWAVGATVAAATALGVIAWVSGPGADRTDTAVPAQAPSAAEDIAVSFLDAYGSFDREEAASYLAGYAFGPEAWRRDNRWFEAVGFQMLDESCVEQESSSPGVRVQCTFDYHALGSDELGRGPFSGSIYTFTIQNGVIVTAATELEFMSNGFSPQMWEPFAAWVARTYPEDAAVMYADWPSQSLESHTPRSLALWEEHTKDYVEAEKVRSEAP